MARAPGAPIAPVLDVVSAPQRLRDPFTGEQRWAPGDVGHGDPTAGRAPTTNQGFGTASRAHRVDAEQSGEHAGADDDDGDDDDDLWASGRRRRAAARVEETVAGTVAPPDWTPPAHLVEAWQQADTAASVATPSNADILEHLAAHPIGMNLSGGYLRCDGVTLTFAGVDYEVARISHVSYWTAFKESTAGGVAFGVVGSFAGAREERFVRLHIRGTWVVFELHAMLARTALNREMRAKYHILEALIDEVIAPRLAAIHVATLVDGRSISLGGLDLSWQGISDGSARTPSRLRWDEIVDIRREKGGVVTVYARGQKKPRIEVSTKEIDAALLPHLHAAYRRHWLTPRG